MLKVMNLCKHKKSGKIYQIVGFPKLKIENDWVEAVLYKLNPTGECFVRPKTIFLEKFKVISDD